MHKMHKSDASQKNIHAILQQRRLRHITGLCIRNLRIQQNDSSVMRGTHDNEKLEVYTEPKIFFKIIVSKCKDQVESISHGILFESEHVNSCSNPHWMNFDIPKTELSTGSEFCLQLWQENINTTEHTMLLSWNWNLSRLSYVAERLYHGEITFSPNALILQISGSFYSFSQCFSTDSPHGNCPHFNLDEQKGSCNVLSLKRMVTCHQSITQAKQRTTEYAEHSRLQMQKSEMHRIQIRKIEDVQKRIKRLKQLLSREALMLKIEQNELRTLQRTYDKKDSHLKENRTVVVDERDGYNEASDKIIIVRQRTGLLNGKLRSRHVEVLSELSYIFPILPYTLPITGKNSASIKSQQSQTTPTFSICDIYLPEAESLNPKDDSKNAVAMGYVSQMLYMISYFLLIPLRYPLFLQGSQTSIIDNVLEKIQEKERVFPLYCRSSKERFLFEYAIYLLNKNIGQMRYLLGIQTSDLRPTLLNLKTLVELAFGSQNQSRPLSVRSSSSIMQKSPRMRKSPKVQSKGHKKEAELNGVRKTPVNLEEKVHDKSAELHSLRGELFGNRKNVKPMPVSPRRFSPNISRKDGDSPSTTYLAVPVQTSDPPKNISLEDVSVIAPDNATAVFLTGLEDLDQSPKTGARSPKPSDVFAARNELFKTRSGRPIITKKHTYGMRSAASSTSHAENYFSTKEELFKRDNFSNRTLNDNNESSSDSNLSKSVSNGLLESPSNIENNNIEKSLSIPAPLALSEDLDLC